jgi:hypothetical protein
MWMMRDWAVVLVVLAMGTACGNLISGDDQAVDHFAAWKAQGGRCAAPAGGTPSGILSEATRLRHLALEGVMASVVDDAGRVRYGRLTNDAEHRALGAVVVEHLAEVDPTQLDGHWEKLAFWINLYNTAVMVDAGAQWAEDNAFRVDDNAFAFFDQEVHRAFGQTVALNWIEHGVLRGDRNHPSVVWMSDDQFAPFQAWHDDLWGGQTPDPRFHFALNCASSSCPPLLPRAYRGDDLDATLDEVTSAFLHDDEKGAGPDGISQIFDFFYLDFEAVGGINDFIAQYRSLDEVDTELFLIYDWSFNISDDDD